MAELNDQAAIERELRARIAELEALVEARGLTIVGLAAQLAEFQGSPTFARGRLAEAERQLAALEATKIIRYSAIPRRAYTKLRRAGAPWLRIRLRRARCGARGCARAGAAVARPAAHRGRRLRPASRRWTWGRPSRVSAGHPPAERGVGLPD